MNKPTTKNYFTNDGMHSAMREYARSKEKTSLSVYVEYSDNSSGLLHVFKRAKIAEKYKTPDGEIYHQDIDSAKFEPDFLPCENPVTIKGLKKLIETWLKSSSPTKIEYKLIESV